MLSHRLIIKAADYHEDTADVQQPVQNNHVRRAGLTAACVDQECIHSH